MLDLIKEYIGKEISVVMRGGNIFTGVLKNIFEDNTYFRPYCLLEAAFSYTSVNGKIKYDKRFIYTLSISDVVGFSEEFIKETVVK